MQNPQRRTLWTRFWEYSREPMSTLTHGLGAILSVFILIALVWASRHTPGRAITLAIFGISMILVYVASTLWHHYNGSETILKRLHTFDHAMIYLMIAGSYTPFTYAFMEGMTGWRWGILITIWALAITGLVLKLFFNMYGHLSTLFYVLMGWVAIIAIPAYIETGEGTALLWILAGGVVYTIGAVIFALERPNLHKHFGHHEIWHLFVLGGNALHIIAAWRFIVVR